MTERYCQVRVSKDGGRNHTAWRDKSLGETGDFCQRVVLRRLGQGRQWVIEVKVTDDGRAHLLAASVQIEPGDD